MKTLTLKIVTPERVVFEEEVAQVTLPIQDGEVTILPEHIPYIGAIKSGEILLRQADAEAKETALAISGGFVEFHNDVLMVLADTAERAEEIDLQRAEEARKRAEELMKERVHMADEEYARTAALLEKELARVRVARKHHTKHSIHLNSTL
jgi:F-type H+-transporting ATPase subunit epsilon